MTIEDQCRWLCKHNGIPANAPAGKGLPGLQQWQMWTGAYKRRNERKHVDKFKQERLQSRKYFDRVIAETAPTPGNKYHTSNR